MPDTYLKFYVQEDHKHHGIATYEWLLEQAKKIGIRGGSAFRAIAGFGRNGKIYEDHFFELAGHLPIEVGFAVKEEEATALLRLIAAEKLSLFYIKLPVESGLTYTPATT